MAVLQHHRRLAHPLAAGSRPGATTARVNLAGQAAVAADCPGRRIAGPCPTWILALPAQLDEANAAAVQAELIAAAQSRPQVLIADMRRTRWCDWAGAGALASAFGRATAAGTQLRLVLTDDTVRRVLSLNGLDRVIPLYTDVETASATPPG